MRTSFSAESLICASSSDGTDRDNCPLSFWASSRRTIISLESRASESLATVNWFAKSLFLLTASFKASSIFCFSDVINCSCCRSSPTCSSLDVHFTERLCFADTSASSCCVRSCSRMMASARLLLSSMLTASKAADAASELSLLVARRRSSCSSLAASFSSNVRSLSLSDRTSTAWSASCCSLRNRRCCVSRNDSLRAGSWTSNSSRSRRSRERDSCSTTWEALQISRVLRKARRCKSARKALAAASISDLATCSIPSIVTSC